MASLDTADHGGGKKKKGGSKQKKVSVHVDFTPMVDMNMLLITFFMLCTSLSKPQTMEINMPTDKGDEDQKNKVKASQAITVICAGKDSLFYYEGQPDYKNYSTLKETSYKPEGLRAYLLKRNLEVVNKIEELRKKKENLKISDKDFKEESSKLKNGRNTPTVVIKATDGATYKNLIDVLDEMAICNIGKYAVVKIEKADNFLIKNKQTNGAFAAQGGI